MTCRALAARDIEGREAVFNRPGLRPSSLTPSAAALAAGAVLSIPAAAIDHRRALGAFATGQGIGASLSGLAAGLIVDHFGYRIAFAAAGVEALAALAALVLALPETGRG